jgi:hypothetical protein
MMKRGSLIVLLLTAAARLLPIYAVLVAGRPDGASVRLDGVLDVLDAEQLSAPVEADENHIFRGYRASRGSSDTQLDHDRLLVLTGDRRTTPLEPLDLADRVGNLHGTAAAWKTAPLMAPPWSRPYNTWR